ncbi:predicted protein [Plenodomus lingam JN3]|uniref:AA1-like domain-containing protein n=1 Tax=Leptosphaeria maculans (strain JN3 / isolate v23.1.3 / race Av1-4-5-6-7-8) TaxID=985895 RepID=E5A6L2_LEPMJ|nr:predicted protein [Plenodomus lingam JN3]CBX99257.1 predicted protein [Plenodomus lingam JN3]
MFAVTLVLALSSAVSALLVAKLPDPVKDGRGVTIWNDLAFKGGQFGIPADGHCTDLHLVYADFNDRTRSLNTEQGYRCEFFLDHGCPTNGPRFVVGATNQTIAVDSLRPDFDNAISSIECTVIVGDTPAINDPSHCEYLPGTA